MFPQTYGAERSAARPGQLQRAGGFSLLEVKPVALAELVGVGVVEQVAERIDDLSA